MERRAREYWSLFVIVYVADILARLPGCGLTISTTASTTTLLGNGATTQFNFNFIADSAADIAVIYTNISGTQTVLLPAQYTLSINPPAAGAIWGVGGTVTYPTSGSPISTGTSLTITRTVPLTQDTSISDQGDFAPTVIETALDTLCLEIQQVAARTGQFRGTWATGNIYNFGDIVVDGINGSNTTNWYLCAIANTAGTWVTDLANGDWVLILNLQAISNPGTVAAGGDLIGNYPDPTIAKIQGVVISGVTGTGNIVLSSALLTPSSTATFTNKTFDTSGTGNVLKIAGDQITVVSGNTGTLATTSGILPSGNIADFDASGNIKDSGRNPLGVARAWAVFNGTTTGTNVPLAGFNVTNITRNSTGNYTVNFTTNLSTANYAAFGMAKRPTSNEAIMVVYDRVTSPTVSALVIDVVDNGDTNQDSALVSITVFGT